MEGKKFKSMMERIFYGPLRRSQFGCLNVSVLMPMEWRGLQMCGLVFRRYQTECHFCPFDLTLSSCRAVRLCPPSWVSLMDSARSTCPIVLDNIWRRVAYKFRTSSVSSVLPNVRVCFSDLVVQRIS
jgi:hypothetical protein